MPANAIANFQRPFVFLALQNNLKPVFQWQASGGQRVAECFDRLDNPVGRGWFAQHMSEESIGSSFRNNPTGKQGVRLGDLYQPVGRLGLEVEQVRQGRVS